MHISLYRYLNSYSHCFIHSQPKPHLFIQIVNPYSNLLIQSVRLYPHLVIVCLSAYIHIFLYRLSIYNHIPLYTDHQSVSTPVYKDCQFTPPLFLCTLPSHLTDQTVHEVSESMDIFLYNFTQSAFRDKLHLSLYNTICCIMPYHIPLIIRRSLSQSHISSLYTDGHCLGRFGKLLLLQK